MLKEVFDEAHKNVSGDLKEWRKVSQKEDNTMSDNTFSLQFSTMNAAFEMNPYAEAGRILRSIANQVERMDTSGNIRDINGNRIGQWSMTGEGIPS